MRDFEPIETFEPCDRMIDLQMHDDSVRRFIPRKNQVEMFHLAKGWRYSFERSDDSYTREGMYR